MPETILYGVRDVQIAGWQDVNTWDTQIDVYGIREAGIEWVAQTGQLEGDDVIIDSFAKLTGATITVNNGSVELSGLALISGGTLTSHANYLDVNIDGESDMPYVGLAIRVVGRDGAEVHYLFPKCSISGNLQHRASYGNYVIPQMQFTAVQQAAGENIMRIRRYAAATNLELPLRTATGGF